MFDKKKDTRSPIKDFEKPLRNPGESLEREIERLFDDEVVPYIVVSTLAIAFMLWEWWRWIFKTPVEPVQVTFFAIASIAFSAYKIYPRIKETQRLRLGLEGEKFIGQYLEDLRSKGYGVFHDIPGEGFNIDHVIVSPNGIFTIETKTFSKPIKGETKIKFDGEYIFVNGRETARDIITQVLAQSGWLQNLLKESTNKEFPIKPIIVFPNWFVDQSKAIKKSNIWALNQKGIPTFIGNEPVVLGDVDIALASSRLSIYVRDYQAKYK